MLTHLFIKLRIQKVFECLFWCIHCSVHLWFIEKETKKFYTQGACLPVSVRQWAKNVSNKCINKFSVKGSKC